jgi:hypothetical protein
LTKASLDPSCHQDKVRHPRKQSPPLPTTLSSSSHHNDELNCDEDSGAHDCVENDRIKRVGIIGVTLESMAIVSNSCSRKGLWRSNPNTKHPPHPSSGGPRSLSSRNDPVSASPDANA